MEITYKKTKQLNMDIISFKRVMGIMYLLLLPSKLLNLFLLKKFYFGNWIIYRNYLKENQDIFPNEYYDYLDINDMIKYTLKRNNSFITNNDFNFVNFLIDIFFKLILLKDNEYKFNETFPYDFNIEYGKFNIELFKSKEYFYNNIYSENYDEQDVIDYLKVALE